MTTTTGQPLKRSSSPLPDGIGRVKGLIDALAAAPRAN